MSYASAAGDCRFALAGDCMPTRRLSIHDEPAYLGLVDLFRGADVGFVNLETVVRRWDEGTPGITQGTFMTTAPELLDDLKWFGVNLVGCANNHAFDYGEGGLLATLDHLDRAGIAHAGSGRNLAEARMPGYLDTKAGRVALVATTATFKPWNRAGAQRPDMRGRPGINPFGFRTSYRVDGPVFAALERLSRELGFDKTRSRNRGHFYSDKEAPPDRAAALDLFGHTFERGEDFAGSSTAQEDDVADNLRWIREARRQADWVVVSFHSHEFGQRSLAKAETRVGLEEPADFVPGFARAAIDAGADLFVGHGSHTPLGIEIYKGKPIFYSVGNFIFQNETVPFFPDEAYSRFGLDMQATPGDFLDSRTGNGTKGHVAHAGFWENIVVTCRFASKALAEIRVHPIEQGFGRSRSERGRPVLAGPEAAARIIERLDRLSRPYGVRLRNEGGSGLIVA